MEKVYSIRTWLCAVVILVVHFAIAAMADSPAINSLIKDLVAVSRDGDDVETLKASILAHPQSELQKTLEEMLNSDGSQSIALRAIEVLQLKGFEAKLRELVRTTRAPDLIFAVNKLGREPKTLESYQLRIKELAGKTRSSALKIALLTGLAEFNEPISVQVYEKLLKDDNPKVAEAAILHLAATSASLKTADVTARFQKAAKSSSLEIQKVAQKIQAELKKP